MSIKEREYVQAAKFMGLSGPKTIVRHLLPNISSLLIIDATLNVGAAILAETGLSFFGFGVQAPGHVAGHAARRGRPADQQLSLAVHRPGGGRGAARAQRERRR